MSELTNIKTEVTVSLNHAVSAMKGGNVLEAFNTVNTVIKTIEDLADTVEGDVVSVAKSDIQLLVDAAGKITQIFNDVKHGNLNFLEIVGDFEAAIADINKFVNSIKAL